MKKNCFFLLSSILLVIFMTSIFGEKIPVNDGAGFDGEFYRQVATSFSSDFFTTGYDAFRIQRIFPFFLINLVFGAFHVVPTHANLMHTMMALLGLNLLVQLFLFYKLAILCKWKNTTASILFACLFFNTFVLQNMGYEVFQTDAFAITLAFASYYALLKKRIMLSFFWGILGFFTWPLVTIQSVLMIVFNWHENLVESKLRKPLEIAIPALYGTGIATLSILLILTGKTGLLTGLIKRDPNLPLSVISLICILPIIYLALRNLPTEFLPNPRKILAKVPWKKALLLAIPLFAIKFFLSQHTNDEYFSSSAVFALQILFRPLKYPLISLVGHVAFYGILPLLIFFSFKEYAKNTYSLSLGHVLMFVITLIFALDSESRHMATLIPLMLVPLGKTLDDLDVKPAYVVPLIILQLVLSQFYLPINTPELLQMLENEQFDTFQSQRYLMIYGAYMNGFSYAIWASISVIYAIFVHLCLKRGSFRASKKTSP